MTIIVIDWIILSAASFDQTNFQGLDKMCLTEVMLVYFYHDGGISFILLRNPRHVQIQAAEA